MSYTQVTVNVWGLYWRYLVALGLSLLVMAFLFERIALLNRPAYMSLQPSIAWGLLAAFFALVTLKQNKGLSYLLLGRRLELNIKIWYWFNAALILMFIALALLGYAVNKVVDAQTWGLYKLYVQPSLLVLWPLCSAWLVVRCINN